MAATGQPRGGARRGSLRPSAGTNGECWADRLEASTWARVDADRRREWKPSDALCGRAAAGVRPCHPPDRRRLRDAYLGGRGRRTSTWLARLAGRARRSAPAGRAPGGHSPPCAGPAAHSHCHMPTCRAIPARERSSVPPGRPSRGPWPRTPRPVPASRASVSWGSIPWAARHPGCRPLPPRLATRALAPGADHPRGRLPTPPVHLPGPRTRTPNTRGGLDGLGWKQQDQPFAYQGADEESRARPDVPTGRRAARRVGRRLAPDRGAGSS